MKKCLQIVLLFGLLSSVVVSAEPGQDNAKDFYALELKDIDGKPVKMESYRGKVLMIVNTASQCGFTPQFKNLVDLQNQLGPRGFQVLAFPSNDFRQDKGSDAEVKKFASENYKINFPLMEKGVVSGDKKQEAYKILIRQRTDLLNEVQWNFEKIIVNRQGTVVERYRSMTKPDDAKVLALLEKLLNEK